MAQSVKNPPAMQQSGVWSLGRENPLEKEKATHSSILAWRIPWTKEPGGLQSIRLQRVRHNWATNTLGLVCRYSESVCVCVCVCVCVYPHACTCVWTSMHKCTACMLWMNMGRRKQGILRAWKRGLTYTQIFAWWIKHFYIEKINPTIGDLKNYSSDLMQSRV